MREASQNDRVTRIRASTLMLFAWGLTRSHRCGAIISRCKHYSRLLIKVFNISQRFIQINMMLFSCGNPAAGWPLTEMAVPMRNVQD